ncbi:MAG: nucleotidyltransferase family protein [Armatimonadota bacterium]
MQAAIEHGLVPLLYLRLHDHSLLEKLAPKQREQLRKLHRRTLILHSGAFGVTHQTLDILRQARIDEALPLKGVALAAASWPEPLLRSLVDLDLLVRPEQVRAAREVLVEAGYVAPAIPWALTRWEYHLPRLECHGLGVELHWRLWPRSPLQPFRLPSAKALLERSVNGVLNDRELRIPSKPDQLLIMAGALAQDGFAVGLRAWADVYWLVERMEAAEIEQAWRLAGELDCQHYLSLVLRGVKAIIGPAQVAADDDPMAAEAYRQLEPVIWHRLLTPEPRRSSVWVLRAMCRQQSEEAEEEALPAGLVNGAQGSARSAIIHSGGMLLAAAKMAGRLGRWLVRGQERLALREDLLLCRVLRGLVER